MSTNIIRRKPVKKIHTSEEFDIPEQEHPKEKKRNVKDQSKLDTMLDNLSGTSTLSGSSISINEVGCSTNDDELILGRKNIYFDDLTDYYDLYVDLAGKADMVEYFAHTLTTFTTIKEFPFFEVFNFLFIHHEKYICPIQINDRGDYLLKMNKTKTYTDDKNLTHFIRIHSDLLIKTIFRIIKINLTKTCRQSKKTINRDIDESNAILNEFCDTFQLRDIYKTVSIIKKKKLSTNIKKSDITEFITKIQNEQNRIVCRYFS